jgi:hypothetical protein
MITPEKLDEIETAAKAPGVTPGPWYNDCGNGEVESRNELTPRRTVCERVDSERKLEIEHQSFSKRGPEWVDPNDDMDYIALVSPDVVLELINEVRLARQRMGPAGYKILEELKESRARVLELEKALSGVSINNCWCPFYRLNLGEHTGICLRAFRALNQGSLIPEGQ